MSAVTYINIIVLSSLLSQFELFCDGLFFVSSLLFWFGFCYCLLYVEVLVWCAVAVLCHVCSHGVARCAVFWCDLFLCNVGVVVFVPLVFVEA